MATKGYVGATRTYTPIEYIESTGTQYIKTNVCASSKTRVETKVYVNDVNFADWQCVFSSRDTNIFNLQIRKSELAWKSNYGTEAMATTIAAASGTIYTIDKNQNQININGSTNTYAAATFTITDPMYLFASHQNDNVTNFFKGKIYYFKMYEDGALVLDLVPVKDENGRACLYDTITHQFLYSGKTSEFIAGSVTGEPVQVTGNAYTVKDIFVGDSNSQARRVIRGYVGVNGVARLTYVRNKSWRADFFLSAFPYNQYGVLGSTTDYVVYAGGYNSSNVFNTSTQWVNKSGVVTNGTNLATARCVMGSASLGGNVCYMGGSTTGITSKTTYCDRFDNSGVRGTMTNLTYSCYSPKAGSNDDYLLVCGGNGSNGISNVVNFYDTLFVQSSGTMGTSRWSHAIGTINNNIVIVGGSTNTNGTGLTNTVEYFDSQKTRTSLSNLSSGLASAMRASLNNHLIIAGGSNTNYSGTPISTAFAYDKDLVRTAVGNLTGAALGATGADYNKEFAVFHLNGNYILSDVYNDSLTKVESLRGIYPAYIWAGLASVMASAKGFVVSRNNANTDMEFITYEYR